MATIPYNFNVYEANDITKRYELLQKFSTRTEAIAYLAERACFDANGADREDYILSNLDYWKNGVYTFERQGNNYAIGNIHWTQD